MAILYSARDLAAIISSMELGCREESHIIDLIWEGENSLLAYQYRADKRKFILEVRRWIDYNWEPLKNRFSEMVALKKEFRAKKLKNKQAIASKLFLTPCPNGACSLKRVQLSL